MSLGSASAVLFDLDGTLLDTAPDFLIAANALRREFDLPDMPIEQLRPVVSRGGRYMVAAAFPELDEVGIDARLPRYLAIYRARIAETTRYFDGMADVVATLAVRGMKLGIVTNKPTWLAEPLLAELRIDRDYGVLVCGDTLPVRKPDPAPFLLAAEKLGVAPAGCVVVGDDVRDIDGGRRAGMRTVAAAYGYIQAHDPVVDWHADAIIDRPVDLLQLLT